MIPDHAQMINCEKQNQQVHIHICTFIVV